MALERDVQQLALRLFRALDTPRSITCYMMVKYGEWDQLVNLSVDPSTYRDDVFHRSLDRLRRDLVATAFLRKCQDIDTNVDLEAAAERQFLLNEQQCYKTNSFLDDWFSLNGDRVTTPHGVPASISLLGKTLNKARKWISNTLGGLPEFLNGAFGPGATFESKSWSGTKVLGLTVLDKISFSPTATPGLSPELENHLAWSTVMAESWGAVLPNRVVPRVPGNRFTSVPKDATKNRGICIEPGLNVFGQLALGSAMKHRLRRRGLDLSQGQDLHRRMAREASRTGSHATLDLSNASDTVALSLVRLLIPREWLDLMDQLRSSRTQLGKKQYVLQKYSSMGNGYTFELETLIFAGLLHAAGCRVGHDTFVYGDDMIVPSPLAATVSNLLTLCGFQLNPKKSFTDGHFRESCGGDFWKGEDVRPFFLEKAPTDAPTWIVLHNRLLALADTLCLPELVPIVRKCADAVPLSFRLYGPTERGDSVLHGPPGLWRARVINGILQVKSLVPVPMQKKLERYGSATALVAAILGVPSRGISPRDSICGYVPKWLPDVRDTHKTGA